MPTWLQPLIVYTLVSACALYSAATLLPRGARVGIATALARLLRQPGPSPRLLTELRGALEAYARRHGAAGACGGCGSCASSQPGPLASGQPTAVQTVHWQVRKPR